MEVKENTLYIKCQSISEIIILELYVDDFIVTGSDTSSISSFKQDMMSSFEMTDLRLMNPIKRDVSSATSGIFISQEKDAKNLLNKFNMQNCKAGRRSWDPLYWLLLLLVRLLY